MLKCPNKVPTIGDLVMCTYKVLSYRPAKAQPAKLPGIVVEIIPPGEEFRETIYIVLCNGRQIHRINLDVVTDDE